MCGRIAQYTSASEIARRFDVLHEHIREAEEAPRYNVAPTTNILAVRQGRDGERELVRLKWGLVPHWSVEPKTSYSTANAKAETVDTKPAFRSAFRSRRCLVPVDGWYEWQLLPEQKYKQPWFYRSADGHPVGIAGLWERWEQGNQILESCTLIVCEANELASRVHDRMPVVLGEEAWEAWLDPELPTGAAKEMLKPCPNDWLSVHPVSRAVSYARNEGPELIESLTASKSLADLF